MRKCTQVDHLHAISERSNMDVKRTLIIHSVLISLTIYGRASEVNPICPMATFISKKHNDQLEQEMLNFLDVKEKPRPAHDTKVKYSTTFMINLYHVISNETDGVTNRWKREFKTARRRLREDEIVKAESSDIVVSMSSINRKSDGVGQRQKLTFSMASIPKTARLISAELKIYQSKKLVKNALYPVYMINIYKPFQLTPVYLKMKKVGEKITSADFTGWLSIDISYIFNSWLEYRGKTRDLFISVQPFTLNDEKEIHPAAIGIVFQNEKFDNEPFILAFLHADNLISTRLPRNIYPPSLNKNFFDIIEDTGKCRLHALRISFTELGWSEWVIAPEGYTTAFCQGTCSFPLKRPQETTNHALVQSLMHTKYPDKFPKPGCAAKETSQLSVLYKPKENTVLRNYKHIIVRSCACH